MSKSRGSHRESAVALRSGSGLAPGPGAEQLHPADWGSPPPCAHCPPWLRSKHGLAVTPNTEVTCHDTTKTAINANGKQARDSTDIPTEVCKERKRERKKKAMHIIQLIKMKKATTDERWSHAYYDTIQLDCFCVETFAFWLITNYIKHSVQFTVIFKSI